METKESPPPYASAPDVPLTPQYHDRYNTPQPHPIPVFVPTPYMTPQQPTTPQYFSDKSWCRFDNHIRCTWNGCKSNGVQAITTHVTVAGPGARGKGSCPVCNGTSWTGSYSCCAWLFCIFCFPVGIICCCCMRKKKCSKCGFTVG